MFKSIIIGCCVLGLSACMASRPSTIAQKKNRFEHYCDFSSKDQYGDAKYQYCRMTYSDSYNDNKTVNSITYAPEFFKQIVIIDRAGEHFVRPMKAYPACSGHPARISIDGTRVDELADKEIINRATSGKNIIEEMQTKWPYCHIGDSLINLEGFEEALHEMRSAWQSGASGKR